MTTTAVAPPSSTTGADAARSIAAAGEATIGVRRLLFDGHQFDGPRLRRAIVRRGWTLRSFAEATGRGRFAPLSETTIRDACRGKGTHDTTAIRIFQTLVERQPVILPEDDVAI